MHPTNPFDEHPERYDAWFERHEAAYRSELAALRTLLPNEGEGLEVGVGTGRFAALLGLQHGIDPSPAMRKRARKRGLAVREGVAEDLPYPDERFDKVLMTTTLCYLDDPAQAFREAYRVLRPGGAFVVGFVDRASPLGRRYEQKRRNSTFYREARFHTTEEVIDLMQRAGFEQVTARQTLFDDPASMKEPAPVREGSGNGGFVALRGTKPAFGTLSKRNLSGKSVRSLPGMDG